MLILLLLFHQVFCLENGLARTPPMGWNTWNQFLCNINETLIKNVADSMSQNLNAIGYEYIVIDDCWQASERDVNGNLQPDPHLWPSGIPALVRYVKSKGLKLGIYSDIGYNTCQGRPGSYGYFDQDIKQFFDWGIEYVKMDFCYRSFHEFFDPKKYYSQISDSIMKYGGKMVFSICEWGWEDPWTWGGPIANMWRITNDIWPEWIRVLMIVETNSALSSFAGPGRWNDPDMVEVGVNGTIGNLPGMPATSLSEAQSRSHFSLWSILASPLILGNNVLDIPPWVRQIITNKAVISVNQDRLGTQGFRANLTQSGDIIAGICVFGTCTSTQVWVRPLTSGSFAVVFFNKGSEIDTNFNSFNPEDITLYWSNLNLPFGTSMKATDLWTGEYEGVFSGSFTAKAVPVNDVKMIKLVPATSDS